MTATLDLRTQTPPQIDAVLADLDYERWVADTRYREYRKIAHEARDYVHYDWRTKVRTPRPDLDRAAKFDKLAAEQAEIAIAKSDEMAPYQEEFSRRGGWTRAFLVVTSGTGHVHSSQRCHTCYPTTQFHWVTKLSGHDESEIVEAAGERACTICYPSAPAEVLNRPTALFTKDEEAKQAARAEREAKKAAAQAASIIDPVTDKVLFKTERGATNEIASDLDSYFRYEDTKYLDDAFKLTTLVADKRGVTAVELWDELRAKAEKKFRRETIKQIKIALGQPIYLNGHNPADPANWHASYRRIAQEEGLI